MKFQFSGARDIPAPRATVWTRLTDPDFVAGAGPGVETVETVDASHFTVTSGLGIGAVKVRFKLDVELFDIEPGQRLKMRARGRAPGTAVEVISAVELEDIGNSHTRLSWSATSDINGAVANVGGRLLEGTARQLTEQFWIDFARRVGAG
jgi:carbon monoxide dehydrogenase subunit G